MDKLNVIALKKLIDCRHCFCIPCFVVTGVLPIKEGKTIIYKDIETPHKKCCNCEMKTKQRDDDYE